MLLHSLHKAHTNSFYSWGVFTVATAFNAWRQWWTCHAGVGFTEALSSYICQTNTSDLLATRPSLLYNAYVHVLHLLYSLHLTMQRSKSNCSLLFSRVYKFQGVSCVFFPPVVHKKFPTRLYLVSLRVLNRYAYALRTCPFTIVEYVG